jgi:hypothetical protein
LVHSQIVKRDNVEALSLRHQFSEEKKKKEKRKKKKEKRKNINLYFTLL